MLETSCIAYTAGTDLSLCLRFVQCFYQARLSAGGVVGVNNAFLGGLVESFDCLLYSYFGFLKFIGGKMSPGSLDIGAGGCFVEPVECAAFFILTGAFH